LTCAELPRTTTRSPGITATTIVKPKEPTT
jgi:hypothetical protein